MNEWHSLPSNRSKESKSAEFNATVNLCPGKTSPVATEEVTVWVTQPVWSLGKKEKLSWQCPELDHVSWILGQQVSHCNNSVISSPLQE